MSDKYYKKGFNNILRHPVQSRKLESVPINTMNIKEIDLI